MYYKLKREVQEFFIEAETSDELLIAKDELLEEINKIYLEKLKEIKDNFRGE